MKSNSLLLALLIVLTGGLMASDAQANPRWEHLGTRQVNFVGDHDTIMVTAHEGRFDAIKLEVSAGNLEMYDVVVTFGNGEKFSPPTRFIFKQGSHSRTIDLPGNARIIRKVDFHYRSKLKRGRAKLSLFGRHPAVAKPMVPAPKPVPVGGAWEHLGSRQVDFVGDHDTIMVTAHEGRFTAIKLEVDRGDLEMYDVVVTFGNGEKFSPPTRFVFNQGTRSRTIDLPGNARIIRKVDFYYRSKIRKGRATLKLFGKHPTGAAAPVPHPKPVPVAPAWERLGSRKVKFRGERDTIPVTAKEGLFDAIKIEVVNGDLEMYDVVVTFANGDKFSPTTRLVFNQGTRSRTIDLPGDARFIRKVDFYYRSKLRRGKADLILYGRHAR